MEPHLVTVLSRQDRHLKIDIKPSPVDYCKREASPYSSKVSSMASAAAGFMGLESRISPGPCKLDQLVHRKDKH